MKLLHFGILCVCLIAGELPAAIPATDYALTLTGTYTTGGERIDLGTAGDDPHARPGPLYLAFTNLSSKPATYTFHTTGPTVRWEFDVSGTVYTCTILPEGSGVNVSKVVQPRQSGVIPTFLYYSQIPRELTAQILSGDKPGQTFVDAKVRVALTIQVTSAGKDPSDVTVTSEWSPFRVGSVSRPRGTEPDGAGQPATTSEPKPEVNPKPQPESKPAPR